MTTKLERAQARVDNLRGQVAARKAAVSDAALELARGLIAQHGDVDKALNDFTTFMLGEYDTEIDGDFDAYVSATKAIFSSAVGQQQQPRRERRKRDDPRIDR